MGTSKVTPTRSTDESSQQAIIPSAEILVMDCGCWQQHQQNFGVICGSQALLGSFSDMGTSSAPLDTLLQKHHVNSAIWKLFSSCKKIGARLILPDLTANGTTSTDAYAPISPNHTEAEKAHRALLSGEDEIFIFIPDMHMGRRDLADDFARFPTSGRSNTESLTNLLKLQSFLSTARSQCPKLSVIQMGDCFDIWESEAWIGLDESGHCNGAYYMQSGNDVVIDPATQRIVESVIPRNQAARASAAARAIFDAWTASDSHDAFVKVLRAFAYYLPGNHDTEVRWLDKDHPLKKLAHVREESKSSSRLELVKKGQKLNFHGDRAPGAVLQWESEHGHDFDDSNRTSKSSPWLILNNVDGKKKTFGWARSERRGPHGPERLLQKKGMVRKTGAEASEVIRDSADTDSITGAVGARWTPHTSEGGDSLGYGQVQEWFAFEPMREALMMSLVERTAALNAGTRFYYCYEETSVWHRTAFYVPSNGGALTLPVRAVIHGHTHTPSLRRLRFVCKTEEDIVRSFDAHSTTRLLQWVPANSDGAEGLLARLSKGKTFAAANQELPPIAGRWDQVFFI
jgi:UDP-2,3-diacylglucosamine pyrophosphatase LpxH